jgi:hypothetical protein
MIPISLWKNYLSKPNYKKIKIKIKKMEEFVLLTFLSAVITTIAFSVVEYKKHKQ